jgi:uncharacterized protein (TIGR00159 family)
MEIVTPVLSNLRWQDMVDILLNSYILFRLYALFRGTNVIRVIAGIALLWIFQRLAVALGLIVTSWAMQGIIAGAALIIIIVFRNEIRNVLQAKNLRAILWDFPHRVIATPVEILVESVYALAKKRTGALIVLPAKEDLDDILRGGIGWDGLVSKEMLLSIFWQDNPVHDGAAVIEGDRITRVGAILPLSKRNDLPSHYGTRHRAAIGLAEATDALVILVSEERGWVMTVKGTELDHISDNLQLKQIIQEHVGILPERWGGRLWEKLEFSLAALVSVLCVAGVWFSFARGLETLVTFDIPVEYMNRDSRMEIVNTSANTVKVDLSGSGALIKSIGSEQIKVKLDLGKASVGTNTYTISSDNVTLPPGVLLRKVDPQVVEVTLDIPVAKVMDIQVDWKGKLAENLILEYVTVVPQRVKVVGGSRLLKDIATIYTEKVPLDAITKSGEISIDLALRPASLVLDDEFKGKVLVKYGVAPRKNS